MANTQKIKIPVFSYDINSDYIFGADLSPFDFSDERAIGRRPVGLEYINRKPITMFGCSFAYGSRLLNNQTVSYKLAHRLKRPVYNRAMLGYGIQNAYMQVTSSEFYDDVPPSDVIYVFIGDNYKRMLINSFWVVDKYPYLHYDIKNNTLVKCDYNSLWKKILRASYILKALNHKYAYYLIENNREKVEDMFMLYLTETRKELQKRWTKPFNFYVVLYDMADISLISKLESKGFIVVSLPKVVDRKFFDDPKYMLTNDNHPNEAGWEYLTPYIIEALGL